jgi:hypothetical protein
MFHFLQKLQLKRHFYRGPETRYLIVEAWTVTPHLETGLEIAVNLASQGKSVSYCNIARHLRHPEGKTNHEPSAFGRLLGYRDPETLGINRAKNFNSQHNLSIHFLKVRPAKLPSARIPIHYLETTSSLQAFEWESKKAGIAIASSLISTYGAEIDQPWLYEDKCNKYLSDYITSFSITQRLIRLIQPTHLIVFNGRFPCVAAIEAAGRSVHVKMLYHERGSTKHRYSLRSFTPHSRVEIQKEIDDYWSISQLSLAEKQLIAHQFFQQQRGGADIAWTSFTKNQRRGIAAELVEKGRKAAPSGVVVTYFTSSDDEIASLADSDYQNSLFSNQKNAFTRFLAIVLSVGHSLIVRVHPHMAIKSSLDKDRWDSLLFCRDLLRSPRIEIVRSSSEISSYELLDTSDIIACYGSTIGIEASLSAKPVVQLGDGISIYDRLGQDIFVPDSIDSLTEWLSGGWKNYVRTSRSAEKYGFWAAQHGIAYQYYKPYDLFSGEFLGMNLQNQKATLRHKLIDFLGNLIGVTRFPDIYQRRC